MDSATITQEQIEIEIREMWRSFNSANWGAASPAQYAAACQEAQERERALRSQINNH